MSKEKRSSKKFFSRVHLVLRGLMFAGTYDKPEIAAGEKYSIFFLNAYLLISAATLLYLAYLSLTMDPSQLLTWDTADVVMADCCFGGAGLLVGLFAFIQRIRNRNLIAVLMCSGLLLFCLALCYLGAYHNTGYEWIAAYPVMAIMLLGWRTGSLMTGLLVVGLALLKVFSIKTYLADYSQLGMGTILGVAIVNALGAIIYEISHSSSASKIEEQNQTLSTLNSSLLEMNNFNELIKDAGDPVCVILASMEIQVGYSRSLEALFGVKDLAGSNLGQLIESHQPLGEDDLLGKFDSKAFAETIELLSAPNFNKRKMEFLSSFDDVTVVASTGEAGVFNLGLHRVQLQQELQIVVFFRNITAERQHEQRLAAEKREREAQAEMIVQVLQLHRLARLEVEAFFDDCTSRMAYISELSRTAGAGSNRKVLSEAFGLVHDLKSLSSTIYRVDAITNTLTRLESLISEAMRSSAGDVPESAMIPVVNYLITCDEQVHVVRELYIKRWETPDPDLAKDSIIKLAESLVSRLNASFERAVALDLSQFDPSVIPAEHRESVRVSLTQFIRNSFAHGLEDVADRESTGKNREMTITVRSQVSTDRVRVWYSDDGRGLNYHRIRETLSTSSKFKQIDAAKLSDDKLKAYIFHEEFSTRETVDDLSGRGVGMSEVYRRIKGAGGSIAVDSQHGKGIHFAFQLPKREMEAV